MKYFILLIFVYLNSFSFELSGLDKKLNMALKLRKINEKVIIDPSVEFTKVIIDKETIKFKTKDLFLKQYKYKKEILAMNPNYHLSIKMKKVQNGVFYSVLNLRNFKKNSLKTLTGYIQLKKTPYTNKAPKIQLLGQI